eukprot:TRINITY_DN939_c0_g1_i3.p1 TRINITY_DN939_c0_g1~~TRINITY_DN939_c0_g1_i3.p1  ORF type:complete len:302 (-),score=52.29 TRINITY_DN939_c0_g1_i3:27-890(-)
MTVTHTILNEVLKPNGTATTTCSKCRFPCHPDCSVFGDDKKGCVAINSVGCCTRCPGKCPVSLHLDTKYMLVPQQVTESVIPTSMIEQYGSETKSHEEAILNLILHYEENQKQIFLYACEMFKVQKDLEAAAIHVNAQTLQQYVEQLIQECEKQVSITEAEVGALKAASNALKIEQSTMDPNTKRHIACTIEVLNRIKSRLKERTNMDALKRLETAKESSSWYNDLRSICESLPDKVTEKIPPAVTRIHLPPVYPAFHTNLKLALDLLSVLISEGFFFRHNKFSFFL